MRIYHKVCVTEILIIEWKNFGNRTLSRLTCKCTCGSMILCKCLLKCKIKFLGLPCLSFPRVLFGVWMKVSKFTTKCNAQLQVEPGLFWGEGDCLLGFGWVFFAFCVWLDFILFGFFLPSWKQYCSRQQIIQCRIQNCFNALVTFITLHW